MKVLKQLILSCPVNPREGSPKQVVNSVLATGPRADGYAVLSLENDYRLRFPSRRSEERNRWSLRLLADKAVELQYIDSISREAVSRLLKNEFRDCHKILFAGVIVIAGVAREGWSITPDEFEALYQSYHTMVYRRLYYLLGEQAAAEDLTQEAFLKLYHSPPREKNNLGGWLLRVAANLAYNYLRGERRRCSREEGQCRDDAGIIPLDEAVIRSQEARLVHQCLAKLPSRDRICLLLKNAGHSYAEIAEVIHVDKNSVGTILARARRHFAGLYNESEGRDDYVSGRGSASNLS